jgi:uncharacterized protein
MRMLRRARVGRAGLAAALLLPALAGAQAEPPAPEARAASAAPLLWRIDREPPSYLFGTIHVPDPRVLALAPAVEGALRDSAAVYTEIALGAQDQQQAQGVLQLPDGETLADALPPALYARAESFAKERGVPLALLQNQKVWVLATLLPLLGYLGRGPALDQELWNWAERHGKRTAGLETLELQVRAMESAGRAGELALLEATLGDLEHAAAQGRDSIDALIELYLEGDEQRIAEHAYAFVDRSDAVLGRLLSALIDERNDYMSAAIAQRLADAPAQAQFFAVGAMHYPGERGILAQLRARGMHLTRLPEPARLCSPDGSLRAPEGTVRLRSPDGSLRAPEGACAAPPSARP